MCGIIGYIGEKEVLPLLINGLKRLEYRGYDSAGVALHRDGEIWSKKVKGKIGGLEREIGHLNIASTTGIGHTRWATHGAPTELNAHPHFSCHRELGLIHNGIIENYEVLKDELINKGHVFTSETDSEVLAHLVYHLYEDDLALALQAALKMVEGTFGIAAICRDEPETIVAARRGSPLVIGIGQNETFLASDGSAIVEHTQKVIYLEDNEMAVLRKGGADVRTLQDKHVEKIVEELPFDIENVQKSGYAHFMLKEIFDWGDANRRNQIVASKVHHDDLVYRHRRCDRGWRHVRLLPGYSVTDGKPGSGRPLAQYVW